MNVLAVVINASGDWVFARVPRKSKKAAIQAALADRLPPQSPYEVLWTDAVKSSASPEYQVTEGPDYAIPVDGSLLLFIPLSEKARRWLFEHCPPGLAEYSLGPYHRYYGSNLVIESYETADYLEEQAEKDGLKK